LNPQSYSRQPLPKPSRAVADRPPTAGRPASTSMSAGPRAPHGHRPRRRRRHPTAQGATACLSSCDGASEDSPPEHNLTTTHAGERSASGAALHSAPFRGHRPCEGRSPTGAAGLCRRRSSCGPALAGGRAGVVDLQRGAGFHVDRYFSSGGFPVVPSVCLSCRPGV
jgi:hypothetical protein